MRALLVAAFVLGATVSVRSAAAFSVEDLSEAMRVEARLDTEGDDKLEAKRLTLKAATSDELEVKGPAVDVLAPEVFDTLIAASPRTGERLPSPLFTLLGRPVVVPAGVEIRGASDLSALMAGLRDGRWVKFRGESEGELLVAERLTLREQTEGRPEVEGAIDGVRVRSAERARLKIGGFRVYVEGDTEYGIDEDEVSLASLHEQLGDLHGVTAIAVDDDDIRPRAMRLAGGRLLIGGELAWRVEPRREFDLDSRLDRNQTAALAVGELEAFAQLSRAMSALVKVALWRVVGISEPPGIDLDDSALSLREAHVTLVRPWSPSAGVVYARVGRQDFDERREWLYDENLDAVRLGWFGARSTRVEGSLAGHLGADNPADRHRAFVILSAETDLTRRSRVGAYAIGRNDPTPSADDARWLGLRTYGNVAYGLKHWLELSWMRGEVGDRRHRGQAFDVGATIEPLTIARQRGGLGRLRPALTLGYARGTGDGDGNDDIDGLFRQTGFDDNNDKFGGVTSFRYYGEVLEPELSNLRIATVGVGMRPWRATSIDVVYHRYRQDQTDDRVRGAEIERRPSGDDPYLGSEIDVVVGYEEIRNLEFELVFGRFTPGAAFAGDTPAAQKAALQVRYKF